MWQQKLLPQGQHVDLNFISLGYKYWATSSMEKQELKQPNFELLQTSK